MKDIEIQDNRWYSYKWSGERIKCCKCGLIHEVNFRLKGKTLQIKAKRYKEPKR